MPQPPLPPLDDSELRDLATLLARYATNHLDQWDAWRLQLPDGPVDVRLLDGDPTDANVRVIWPPEQ